MTAKRSVSVVIATYNRATLLPETIRSIAGQTCPPREIIIIDDGSTDETPEVVRTLGPGIRYQRIANQGPLRARAHGIRLATSDYIAVVDDDDLWLPLKLEIQLAELERTGCSWVYGDAMAFDDATGQDLYRFSQVCRPKAGRILSDLLLVNFIPSPTVVIDRGLLQGLQERPGRPDVRFGEDWMTWLLAAVEHPIARVDAVVARYRVHTASAAARTSLRQRLADSERVLDYCQRVLPAPERHGIPKARALARLKTAVALTTEGSPAAGLALAAGAVARRPVTLVDAVGMVLSMGLRMLRAKRQALRKPET